MTDWQARVATPWTMGEALADARSRLAATPESAPWRDAELLLRHVTGLSRAELLTRPDSVLTTEQATDYASVIERRALSEPVQYITGAQEFYGLPLRVTPAVLIPRPETEHLLEAALDAVCGVAGPLRILDVGTGSGAIAIALAYHLPNATVVATDISAAALTVARGNAEEHGVSDRIEFVEADLLPSEFLCGHGCFDLVCSNPPYVATWEVLELQVAAFEPHTALFAGADGLEVYRRLIPLAAAVLRPAGAVLLEIGHGQQAAIESLLLASHLEDIRFLPDLQGIARVAIARKQVT